MSGRNRNEKELSFCGQARGQEGKEQDWTVDRRPKKETKK
jgi:hypothetical protein